MVDAVATWTTYLLMLCAVTKMQTVDGKVDPPLCRWATTTVADFIQILMKYVVCV